MDKRVFKGYNGDLIISDTGIRIGGGMKRSLMTQTIRGEKMIPWESIIAVQYRKANLAGVGYLQLSLRGGSEAKSGLMQAVQDENTVTWSNFPTGTKKNAEFAEARDLILAKISADTATKTCPDCAEEIKIAANVCRFCGYRFASDEPSQLPSHNAAAPINKELLLLLEDFLKRWHDLDSVERLKIGSKILNKISPTGLSPKSEGELFQLLTALNKQHNKS